MLTDIFKLALVLYEEYGLRIGLSVFAFILGLSGLWKGRVKIGALLKLAWSRDKATYEIIEGALTSILWKLQADRAFLFDLGYRRPQIALLLAVCHFYRTNPKNRFTTVSSVSVQRFAPLLYKLRKRARFEVLERPVSRKAICNTGLIC